MACVRYPGQFRPIPITDSGGRRSPNARVRPRRDRAYDGISCDGGIAWSGTAEPDRQDRTVFGALG